MTLCDIYFSGAGNQGVRQITTGNEIFVPGQILLKGDHSSKLSKERLFKDSDTLNVL